jgi:hypothetical protein
MLPFVDHGTGSGERVVQLPRPREGQHKPRGDQIAVLDAALAQLPADVRRRILVRGDAGSGVQAFVWRVHNRGLEYSVGVHGRQLVPRHFHQRQLPL